MEQEKSKKNMEDGGTEKLMRREHVMMRRILFFSGMLLLLFGLVAWNVGSGSQSMSFREILDILTGKVQEGAAFQILWNIRFPRICAAFFLGGALAVSGFLLQTFFGNPIAGPYVLGISSGAKLVVAIVMIMLLSKGVRISSFGMMAAAFVGAMIAMGFVLLVSLRVQKMSLLIVCGIMIGYICSAVTELLVTFADDSNIVNLHNWSMGSFSGMVWGNVKTMAWIVLLTCVITFLLSKPIGAYQMGEAYARNMGVNIRGLRILLILFSSILSACVTAFAGPISFVGIAVPHLVKLMTKTAKPYLMIPGCFLCGAVVTLFCDGIARTIFAPTEVSISSVTAVLLAPVVILMMIRKGEKRR